MKILLLADYNPGEAAVISDFMYCFDRYSRHNWYHVYWPRRLPRDFDLERFDAIVISWSIWLAPPPGIQGSIPDWLSEKLQKSKALKVLFLQDEHRAVRPMNEAMAALGVNIMFTCVAESNHELFYPKSEIPSLEGIYTVLTGYVPQYLENRKFALSARPTIDIGYRSREVPYHLGDLAREKTVIARRWIEIAERYGFSCNISIREEDRIYGAEWLRFLRSTRFQLGTPSGASVIDFTGEIEANCRAFLRRHPHVGYDEVKRRFFAGQDGSVAIDTVSPRVFEYAAVGNVMVMHDGDYGGIVVPDRHYIPVKKDYTNIEEVIEKMRSPAYYQELVKNAYADLIASRRYNYDSLVRRVDGVLTAHRPSSVTGGRVPRAGFYAGQLVHTGQFAVAVRGREVILPVPRGARYLGRRLLGRLLYTVPRVGPVLRRRGGDPITLCEQWFVALGRSVVRPELARLLRLYGSDASMRRGVPLDHLLRDLCLLSCIYDAMRPRRAGARDYYVLPKWHDSEGILEFRSLTHDARPMTLAAWSGREGNARAGSFWATVAERVHATEVNTVRWSHLRLPVGVSVSGVLVKFFGRPANFVRGRDGYFVLSSIGTMLQARPEAVLPVLERLFTYDAPPIGAFEVTLDRCQAVYLWFARIANAITAIPRLWKLAGPLRWNRPARGLLARCVVSRRLWHLAGGRRAVRELLLLATVEKIERAEVFTDAPFHLVPRQADGRVDLVSRPGPWGWDDGAWRRELVGSLFAAACDGRAPQLGWDHSAIAAALGWRVPGEPRCESRIGAVGVMELPGLSALLACDPRRGAKFLAGVLCVPEWQPPSRLAPWLRRHGLGAQVRLPKLPRLWKLAGPLRRNRPARGLLARCMVSRRLWHLAGGRRAVRELLLLATVERIERAEVFTDAPFHLVPRQADGRVDLVSRPGPWGWDDGAWRRELVGSLFAAACDGRAPQLGWDHSAIAAALGWRVPGAPRCESRIGAVGVMELPGLSALLACDPRRGAKFLAGVLCVPEWRPPSRLAAWLRRHGLGWALDLRRRFSRLNAPALAARSSDRADDIDDPAPAYPNAAAEADAPS